MAYGVKYRLDFRDDRGYLRRVDILKNNYTGSVFPWYGTDDPILIEWASNDDFYSPIIGSSATLNMMVTDSVYYENFFEYDEREYQVRVYFDNGGGGWNQYWVGYITNDVYQEPIKSTPYSISIKANDGIGTLEGYNTWTPPSGDDYCTLWEVVYNNLNYLGLDFDIYISNDIRDINDSAWSNVFNSVTINKVGLFTDYYTIRNAKETLASIMLMFNCRIFQAYGGWFIVNNSSYGDQRVLDYIQANQSASESTILGVKQGYLNAGSENIKYYQYNYQGTYLANTTTNKLLRANIDIKQVNNNLYKLVKKPIKQVQQINDISQKFFDVNWNASFEFGFDSWTTSVGSYGILKRPKSGEYALFTNEVVLTETQVEKFVSSPAFLSGNTEYEFQLSIMNLTNATTNKIWWTVGVTDSSSGLEYFYYGAPNASANWGTNFQWNEIVVGVNNDYYTYKKTMEKLLTPSGANINGNAKIYISKPYSNTTTGYSGTYLDNIAIRYTNDLLNKYQTLETIIYNPNDNRSGVIKTEDVYFANVPSNIFAGNFGNQFKRVQDTSGKKLEEIAVRQRFNDNFNYVETFNSDFTSTSGSGLIDLTNKVWLKLTQYTESDSCIIDFMSVNLKKNQYNIQMHIPHNYVDAGGGNEIFYQNYKE